jgi:formamidopyrimidine-DNA glycosylase
VTGAEPAELVDARVRGTTIVRARRRGKLAVLDLDSGESLVISLRMTGKLLVRDGAAAADPYVRGHFRFESGKELRFSDTRKFGRIVLVPREQIRAAAASDGKRNGALHERLGVEPLSGAFTLDRFRALLAARRRSRLKPLLLDQEFIAGIGNIYANEALYRARVHPLRSAGTLRAEQVRALYDGILASLRRAIALRGSSIDDYRDARGRRGRMQREFLVHGREDEPCQRCGRPIRKAWVAGRGTYWCPSCQRAPVSR